MIYTKKEKTYGSNVFAKKIKTFPTPQKTDKEMVLEIHQGSLFIGAIIGVLLLTIVYNWWFNSTFECVEYTSKCHNVSCTAYGISSNYKIGETCGYLCDDICVSYKLRNTPTNETQPDYTNCEWLTNDLVMCNTTTSTSTTTTTIIPSICHDISDCDKNTTAQGCKTEDCNVCCCEKGSGGCSCTLVYCSWNYCSGNKTLVWDYNLTEWICK